MSPPKPILAALRDRIDAIEGLRPATSAAPFPLGLAAIDARLGGGLARGRLHELYAAEPDDHAAASAFALMLALRAGDGAILWLRQDHALRAAGRINGAGLVELGVDPARLIEILVPDEKALLRAAGDAVRCPDMAALLIEPWRAARTLDLTVSRRLALAAEQSGVTTLLIRSGADPGPSAAHSRWRIGSIPAVPLEADAPGHAAIGIDLLRHRAGIAAFTLDVEWDRDHRRFREPPLSGALLPLPAQRSAAA
jgi:protein ImuA